MKERFLKLSNVENLVLAARMEGDAICDMDKKELPVFSDVAIFKIAAISGLSLPTSDKFADILNEEFLILLNEFGYNNLTFEEVVLAFRINAKGTYRTPSGNIYETVSPYSTFFSMSYAASVLNNYISIRGIIERKIVEQIEKDKYTKYSNQQ